MGMKKKTKTIKMSPELAQAMQEQLASFKEKFGRDAGPNDPVFFDPDADTPQPISVAALRATVIKAAKKAGLDPKRVLRGLGFDEPSSS